MAKGVSIQVDGLDKLIKKFGSIPENVKTEIDASLSAAAKNFEDRAVSDAPTNNGLLKNSITTKQNGEMDYEVVCSIDYAAFVEFGTRARVQVPAGLADYAAQFIGAKGSAPDAKKAIFQWCKDKGIDPKLWQRIYFSIMVHGIHPHPFFFKQMPLAQTEVNADLKGVVERALSK
jgi:HK97 gp10 family phage protein